MRLSELLKSPIYAAQLATGTKSFQANPILGSKKLNEMGLHVKRVKAAMDMADWRRSRLAAGIPAEHIEQYNRDGLVVVENFLSDELFKQIQHELEQPNFDRNDMLQGPTITRRSSLDKKDGENHPALLEAKNDPRFTRLLRYVASHGGQPLLTLQTVLALPARNSNKGTIDPQTVLHSDTFHPTAKAWLFLSDVGENDGPFSYVKGSHKMTPERYAWEKHISQNIETLEHKYSARGSLRIMASELEGLDYPEPSIMTVQANTLVVADTHGFHARCASPQETTRIEIYGSLRRNPYLPVTGFHPASLPILRERTNRAAIEGLRLLERMKIRNSPWKHEGRGPVDEWPERLIKLRT